MDRADLNKFGWNEARLMEFFRSGESEMTRRFQFLDVYCPINGSKTAVKGLFLKQSAKPGQLLMVANAIASCSCTRAYTPYDEGAYIHAPKAGWQPRSPRIPPDVHKHLFAKLLEYFYLGDANDCEQIMSLDSKRHSYESAGTSSSKEAQPAEDLPTLLWNVVANHAMCTKVRSLSRSEPMKVETCEFWGFWILPSLINHSCAPNCHRMIVGETMFIRSAKDIAAGEELTLPYFDIFEPLSIRDAHSQSSFGFRCECPRCTFERSLGTPYTDIQKQIVELKTELETEWWTLPYATEPAGTTSTGAHPKLERDFDTMMILQDLSELFRNIIDLTSGFLQAFNLNLNNKLDLKNKDPKSKSKKKQKQKQREKQKQSKEKLEPLTMTPEQQAWIRASFIDVDIALYALCATFAMSDTPFPCLYDPLAVLGIDEWAERETEGVKKELRTFTLAFQLVGDVEAVHPGNMLGQEFCAIMAGALSRLTSGTQGANISANLAKYIEETLPDPEAEIMKFYIPYYGYSTMVSEILMEPVAIES
ncbi:unnamed protein product [Calypogeia fissa]